MRHTKCHVALANTALLLLAVLASALAGCGSAKKTSATASKLPDDPKPVKVVEGQAV